MWEIEGDRLINRRDGHGRVVLGPGDLRLLYVTTYNAGIQARAVGWAELKQVVLDGNEWHELNAGNHRGAVLSLQQQRSKLIEERDSCLRTLIDVRDQLRRLLDVLHAGDTHCGMMLVDTLLSDLAESDQNRG